MLVDVAIESIVGVAIGNVDQLMCLCALADNTFIGRYADCAEFSCDPDNEFVCKLIVEKYRTAIGIENISCFYRNWNQISFKACPRCFETV